MFVGLVVFVAQFVAGFVDHMSDAVTGSFELIHLLVVLILIAMAAVAVSLARRATPRIRAALACSARSLMPRGRLSKLMLALTLGAGVVLLTASPAFAHAVFEGSEPADGTIYPIASPPTSISMHWGESVGIKLGAVRMYDEHGHMVNIGAPYHPPGDDSTVDASLPHLGAGTYVVTWRVISADTHPVSGAFTFSVGPRQTNVSGLATKLLSSANGSKTVGVLYGTERFVLFSSLIALFGGAAFIALVWPAGRRSRRARRIVWTAWAVALGITVFGFAIEGIYAAGFPLRELFSSTVLSDTLHERYGETAVARIVLLVLIFPLAPDPRPLRTQRPRDATLRERSRRRGGSARPAVLGSRDACSPSRWRVTARPAAGPDSRFPTTCCTSAPCRCGSADC